MSFQRLCMKTQKKRQPHVEGCEDSTLSELETPSPVSPIGQTSNKSVISTYSDSDSDSDYLIKANTDADSNDIVNCTIKNTDSYYSYAFSKRIKHSKNQETL